MLLKRLESVAVLLTVSEKAVERLHVTLLLVLSSPADRLRLQGSSTSSEMESTVTARVLKDTWDSLLRSLLKGSDGLSSSNGSFRGSSANGSTFAKGSWAALLSQREGVAVHSADPSASGKGAVKSAWNSEE